MAAMMAIMATTIINSISVKPLLNFFMAIPPVGNVRFDQSFAVTPRWGGVSALLSTVVLYKAMAMPIWSSWGSLFLSCSL
jgi:hypothetical protein